MRDERDPAPEQQDVVSRQRFLQTLGGAGLALGTFERLLAPGNVASAAGQAQYLVLITLDACRADYLSLAPMRHLHRLIAAGTVYDGAWVGQIASETPTGHATLGTGVFPRRHGILGFEWRDGHTHKEVLDGWPPGVKEGRLDRDLQQSTTGSISQAVKATSHAATVVAVSSEKVYAADAMGGPLADYVVYCERDAKHPTTTPTPLRGHLPLPASYLSDPAMRGPYPVRTFTEWDGLSARLAVMAVQEVHPKALMVNFPGPDVYGHPYGGPASPAVMRRVLQGVDRGIGQIMTAYRRAGIFQQTLFVVVGDHGMVPNTHVVSTEDVNHAIAQAGAGLLFQTGGTAKYLYLQDPSAAPAVATHLAGHSAVAAAYYRTSSTGSSIYMDAEGGTNRLAPALQAAHHYLLDTFACDRAPDVVAVFRENTIGRAIPTLYGYHGGLTWGAQHVPLVLSGPGVRRGQTSHFAARLVDVTPTVLALLGMRGTGMDGVVLADALATPEAADVTAQATLAPTLAGYRDALSAQSAADIADDLARGLKLPPASPIHPMWAGTCCGY